MLLPQFVALSLVPALALARPSEHIERDAAPSALPIVNLGYQRHQAISFNESSGIYNFSNVRYAQPPVGDLRFRAPLPVNGSSDVVDNGSIGRVCAEAYSAWNPIGNTFAEQFFTTGSETFDYNAKLASLPNATVLSGKLIDPRTTEDCLFLDIQVPKVAFSEACKTKKLPVMIYFYGGGYTLGEKSIFNPTAIIEHSNDSMIFVAINYRLGAFGWLAGPGVVSDGTLNAGLHDQRLALDWVQQYIHLFGGDKTRVTVAGGSAGAGSIEHHIASYGGQGGPLPFAQAITSSPAFYPVPNITQYSQVYQAFFKLLNVTTIQEARKVPFEKMVLANLALIWNSGYGSNSFGPVVDGTYVPNLPGVAFLKGAYHKDVQVFTSHCSDEGILFTDPRINSSAAFDAHIEGIFPFITPSALDYVTKVLYPPVFDGSYGYTTNFDRTKLVTQDATLICNANYLDRAFIGNAKGIQFSVFPGLHGQDTDYIFPVPESQRAFAWAPYNTTVAGRMQQFFANFVTSGDPGAEVPMYGSGAQVLDLSDTGIKVMKDMASNPRCDWWQQAKYYYQ